MRTSDFSKAPKQGRAAAVVIVEFGSSAGPGGERRGPVGLPVDATGLAQVRTVPSKVSAAPGYVWHKTFRRRGVPGVLVFFASVASAEAFVARTSAAAGSVQLLHAEPTGYSNGVWRAEGNVMAHIEHFTPTSSEASRRRTPPLVASGTATRPPAQPHVSAPLITGRGGRAVTEAQAMFVGATKYRGPAALVTLSRTWYPMIARMRRLPGYVWHTVYWEPPFTLGTLAFFATRDDLLGFARMPAHRHLMQWITDGTKHGTGGYIRLHSAPAAATAGVVTTRAAAAGGMAAGRDNNGQTGRADHGRAARFDGDHAAPDTTEGGQAG
ncbi:hypothetical protein [Subtercola sp. YIM 133946]|uniref:hypothetical protein n=1 Tax=Subtercola sp. YIM 133946 TaxID=3118909 RepID=UPI002F92CF10